MLTIRHYVAKSSIAGCGLFCARAIKRNEMVYEFDYRFVMLISDAEIESLNNGMKEAVIKYSYRGTGSDRLTGAVYYCVDDSRFMNHSDSPNTMWVADRNIYLAKFDIPADTELTCNYSDFCARGDFCFDF